MAGKVYSYTFVDAVERHNRLNLSYHSGETGGLHTLISTPRDQRYPDRNIAATGVSFGSNVLLKYLGAQGDRCPLTAAMAISVPFDLADSAKRLDNGFAKIYQHHLISRLIKKMLDKFKNKSSPIDLDKLNEWNNFSLI